MLSRIIKLVKLKGIVAGRVYKNSIQPVPNVTNVGVVNYIKQYDSHNAFNASSGVLTVPKSGLLSASAQVFLSGSADGNVRSVNLMLNDIIIAAGYTATRADGNSVPSLSVHSISVKAGDLIKITVYQDSGTLMLIPKLSGLDEYVTNFSWRIE